MLKCHGFSYFTTVLSDNPNDIYYDCDYSKDDVTFLRVVMKKYYIMSLAEERDRTGLYFVRMIRPQGE